MARTPPLNPSLPMVDPESGNPTPFFMRWWQDQIKSNALIVDLSTPAAITAVLDLLGAAQQGQIIFRGATNWEFLDPDTDGKILSTKGAGADPIFDTLTSLLDTAIGSDQGSILYRGTSSWSALAAGTSGNALLTQGAAADPIWGSVTSAGQITFVEKRESAHGTWTFADTPEVGDCIVLFGSTDVEDATTKLISGFVQVDADVSEAPSCILQYKILEAGDLPYASVVMPDFGSSSHNTQWVGAHLRNVASVNGSIPTRTTGSGVNIQSPDYTTDVDDSWLIIAGGLDDDPTASITHPAGFTEFTADFGSFNSTSMMAGGKFGTAGLQSPDPFVSNLSDQWVGMAVAFEPGPQATISAWVDLPDTPSTITPDEIVKGNAGGTALEFSTVNDVIDAEFGTTQGGVLYRGASAWTLLPPGVSGEFLKTLGAGANPLWAAGGAGATTYLGLTDVPASYSAQAGRLPKVNAGETAMEFATLTAYMDTIFGSTQGSVLYRSASVWGLLAPGTSGHFLKTLGAGTNPLWAAAGGGGAFTDLSDTPVGLGTEGQVPAVDSAGTALEFVDVAAGGGDSVSVDPVVRDSLVEHQASSSTYTANFPAGALEGDLVIIMVGGAWAATTPTDWEKIGGTAGANFQNSVYSKVMSSGDISTGSVSITMSGSYQGVVCAVAFEGVPPIHHNITSMRSSTGVTTWDELAITDAPLYLVMTGTRGNTTVGVSDSTTLDSDAGTNATGGAFSYVPADAAPRTIDGVFGASGTGWAGVIIPILPIISLAPEVTVGSGPALFANFSLSTGDTISESTDNTIQFDTEDRAADWATLNTSTGVITISDAGTYIINGQVWLTNGSGGDTTMVMSIHVEGVLVDYTTVHYHEFSWAQTVNGQFIISLEAGDEVELIFNYAGGAGSSDTAVVDGCHLQIAELISAGVGAPSQATTDLTAYGDDEFIIADVDNTSKLTVILDSVAPVASNWRPSIQVSLDNQATWLTVSGDYLFMRMTPSYEQISNNSRIFTGSAAAGASTLIFKLHDCDDPSGNQDFEYSYTDDSAVDLYMGRGYIPASDGKITDIRIFNQEGTSNLNAGDAIVKRR